jgi:DNA-directed RNA polymerase specialized sigma24 family protein
MRQFSAQIDLQEPNLLANQQDAAAREARFAAFVERQSRFVFRVAYALLRNSYDAEDVVQETFLKIYRAGAWDSKRRKGIPCAYGLACSRRKAAQEAK